MITDEQKQELGERIRRIVGIAREIEAAPNFGADLWTMQEIDKGCQQIRGHGARIGTLVGTGDVLYSTNLPRGMHPITTAAAAHAQAHLGEISRLVTEIERVENFGPSVWEMREIDKKCQQVVAHCGHVWMAVNPSNTGS